MSNASRRGHRSSSKTYALAHGYVPRSRPRVRPRKSRPPALCPKQGGKCVHQAMSEFAYALERSRNLSNRTKAMELFAEATDNWRRYLES